MTFYDIIYTWVSENFGENEANDPSWSIEALAKCLQESNINTEELNASTKWLAYDEVRE